MGTYQQLAGRWECSSSETPRRQLPHPPSITVQTWGRCPCQVNRQGPSLAKWLGSRRLGVNPRTSTIPPQRRVMARRERESLQLARPQSLRLVQHHRGNDLQRKSAGRPDGGVVPSSTVYRHPAQHLFRGVRDPIPAGCSRPPSDRYLAPWTSIFRRSAKSVRIDGARRSGLRL